ncbi:glycosyltransferase family 10 [Synergistaceae bacterium OttesenSCG-928-I11]|nr:glycosyltransferase family 10 [Synergistaceae bacterium OttesenSCG-928-I11]
MEYLEQFATVISPYVIPGFSGRLMVENPRLGWLAGRGIGNKIYRPIFSNLSDVRNYPRPDKKKKISIISSLKKSCVEYQKRILFLEALIDRFGNRIDYYGRDFAPIDEKLDAIAPYRYHICIENSIVENYWTEKLADAWIGWSLPIYCGAPNIREKLPDSKGIEVIDIDNIPESLRKIEKILCDDDYDTRIDAIASCREWVIQEVNPFGKVAEIIENAPSSILQLPRLASPYRFEYPRKRKKTLIERMSRMIISHRGKRIATRVCGKYRALRQ